MKVQEVVLRAMAKKITWWQAAEIIGITDRQMRRLYWRYREHGYEGLLDRLGKPSPERVPLAVVERVLALYREKHFDLNLWHFHERLQEEHRIRLSPYLWMHVEFFFEFPLLSKYPSILSPLCSQTYASPSYLFVLTSK